MTKENLRIVFMGTPDFAVESLRILVENKYNVVGVITMPDKPAGRGHKLQTSAVKKYTLEHNLPLLQPEKLKDETFLDDLKALKADLQIVVAFRMLPEIVWNMPSLGTFNLHGSLLPMYRGAAPINWAIINGEKETGVTTFFLTHEIDTGKVILQAKTPISESDNAGTVHDRLMTIGAELVKNTVDLIIDNKVESTPQHEMYRSEAELKDAPKIFKDTCRIDWYKSAFEIHNLIRGLSPYPASWTEMSISSEETSIIKIYQSSYTKESHSLTPGTIITDNKHELSIACKDGFIHIEQLQLPGKKAMSTDDLLRGYKIAENSKLI